MNLLMTFGIGTLAACCAIAAEAAPAYHIAQEAAVNWADARSAWRCIGSRPAFASGGDGTLTVVHEDGPQKISVVQTVATRIGARTVTLDEKTHRVYTVTAKYAADGQPSGRPKILPGTFSVLAFDP